MGDLSKKLKTELQLTVLTSSKMKDIVEKGNLEKIARHKEALAQITSEVDKLKLQVKKAKLESGESVDEIWKWDQEVEGSVEEADSNVTILAPCLEEAAVRAENAKLRKEEMLIARKREEELKFEKKVEMQLADKPVKSTGKSVKLPKLVITKYDGTFEKWLSFWNTFKAEVDSQDIPAVTKFAFLKEFPEPKVRETIDGLPFSTEGSNELKIFSNPTMATLMRSCMLMWRTQGTCLSLPGLKPGKYTSSTILSCTTCSLWKLWASYLVGCLW